MDNSFFEENDKIIVSFRTKTVWKNNRKNKKEIRKFKRKGYFLSDESTYIIDKDGFSSILVFIKNK